MNDIVELIAEYLLSNRRLVVPGFGAFMVKDTGERVFADLLRTDDGVLTSLLREKGMNEMEAAIMIDRFIFEVRYELENYGYCRLGEVGTLRIEPDTKALRLCPQVKSEVEHTVQSAPYVPEPVSEVEDDAEQETTESQTENHSVLQGLLALYGEPKEKVADVASDKSEVAETQEKPEVEKPEEPEVADTKTEEQKTKKPRKQPKKRRRKGADWVIVVAIIVVLAALAVVAYGFYVSTKNTIGVTANEEVAEVVEVVDSLRTPQPGQIK